GSAVSAPRTTDLVERKRSRSAPPDRPIAPPNCRLGHHATVRLVLEPRRGRHMGQRTYNISIGTGSLEESVIVFFPVTFTSKGTSETATPSEHAAITCRAAPSSCTDLTVHF